MNESWTNMTAATLSNRFNEAVKVEEICRLISKAGKSEPVSREFYSIPIMIQGNVHSSTDKPINSGGACLLTTYNDDSAAAKKCDCIYVGGTALI